MSLAYTIETMSSSCNAMLQNYDLFEATLQQSSNHINHNQMFTEQVIQPQPQPQQSQYIIQRRTSSDPPPLAFFKKTISRTPVNYSSEPPPLVLIRKK